MAPGYENNYIEAVRLKQAGEGKRQKKPSVGFPVIAGRLFLVYDRTENRKKREKEYGDCYENRNGI